MWSIAIAAALAAPELAFDPEHRVSVGARGDAWVADYAAPGVGGHLDIRPWRTLGVQAFADTHALFGREVVRQDHVLGFHLYRPLIGSDTAFLAPTVGSCVDLRFQRDPTRQSPSSSDIRWGLHAGALAQFEAAPRVLVQLHATLYGYLGNQTGQDGWSAVASNRLHVTGVGQLGGAAAWRF